MNWLSQLIQTDSVARSIFLLGAIAACGLILGSIKIRGVGLGVAGVLFSGLMFGHFGATIDEQTIEFVRNATLVIFVYAIGIQVGPGFVASLRRNGLALNGLAVLIVLLGCGLTLALATAAGIQPGIAVGIYSGSVTNTPALAAAQQALRESGIWVDGQTPALGYAATYPLGVLGIILSILFVKRVLRYREEPDDADEDGTPRPISVLNILVSKPGSDARHLRDVTALCGSSAVISRHLSNGTVTLASPESVISQGDVLLAVGERGELQRLCENLGEESPLDLRTLPSQLQVRQIVVTEPAMLGRPVEELDLHLHGIAVTRLQRNNVEIVPSPKFKVQFGDVLQLVGEEQLLKSAAKIVGNSTKALERPQIVPILLGIGLGVLLGSWPIELPGMAAPIKLGLAGGPLLVAIVLSRIGRIGPLSWYLPTAANHTIRELSIALFLACVGLSSGAHFADAILRGSGLVWIACGAVVTIVPLLVAAVVARLFLKLDFNAVSGLLAGSMTDPPALAFASSLTSSERSYVSYAAVYPLTMVLRVITAQLLVGWLLL